MADPSLDREPLLPSSMPLPAPRVRRPPGPLLLAAAGALVLAPAIALPPAVEWLAWLVSAAAIVALAMLQGRASDPMEALAPLAMWAHTTPDTAIVVGDAAGRVQWANPAFHRWIGPAGTEVVGRPLAAWVTDLRLSGPRAAAGIEEGEGCVGSGGATRRVAVRRCRLGGAAADGSSVLVLEDLTERHRLAAELAGREAQLRAAWSAMQEGCVLQSAEGTIVQANAAAATVLGTSVEQLQGRSLLDAVGPAVREDGTEFPADQHPAFLALRTGSPQPPTLMGVERPDGARAWLRVSASPVQHPGEDRPHAVVTTLGDMTARQRDLLELRKLQQAVQQSPAMVLITDASGRIEYVNRQFTLLSGHPPEDAIGRTPAMLASGLTPPATYAAMWAALGAGQEWRGELVNRDREGAEFIVDAHIFPLRDARGATTHFVAVERDLTGERQHARDLAAAREEARAASRAKAEFLQNIRHELRTPMNGILGMADLLLAGDLRDGQREDLRTLRRAADHLLGIINQVLELGRSDSDPPAREPFHVRGVIAALAARFSGECAGRGLAWDCIVGEGVPESVCGDPTTLRQILEHLLDNAVRFTPEGEVRVEVRGLPGQGDAVRLCFEVRDTGIGIEPERQREMFEAFRQADGSTTRSHDGVGLGLTLAEHLVRRMGGRLELDSQPGRGSRFHFALEFGRLAAGAVPESLHPLAGVCVWLAADARSDARGVLERWGMRVARAAPLSGWGTGDAPAPRVLILDLRRESGEPRAAVAAARSLPGLARVPVVAWVSSGSRGDAEGCRGAGAAAYLSGDAHEPELHDAIARALEWEPGQPLITRHSLREERTRRVLIVEDHAVNRRVAARLLERSGYEVTTACDGVEGVEAYRTGQFDCVLMDLQMPVLDGLEATRAIRRLEASRGLPRVPILAVTAHHGDEVRAECLAGGMDGMVGKPIRTEELLTAMQGLRPTPLAETEAQWGDLIDWQDALRRLDGDEPLLRELCAIFLADSPGMRERLLRALDDPDLHVLERTAHGLKGAAATLSAGPVRELALEVEVAARHGLILEARAGGRELVQALDRLVAVLGALPPEGPRAAA